MTSKELFKRQPIQIRKGIPVFVEKRQEENQADRYERYWEVVVRQLLLHYGDDLGLENGFLPMYEFVFRHLGKELEGRILEVGGGVGRLAGELAMRFPYSRVYLLDYSYNMLRSAQDLWLNSKDIDLDGRHLGWPKTILSGRQIPNLWLGQARGEDLPFFQETMDVVLSTFFIDRAANLEEAIREQVRVLRTGGKLIIVSPLNFQRRAQWEKYGDPEKLTAFFLGFGLRLIKFEPEIICREQLDARGNTIVWRAVGWYFAKVNVPTISIHGAIGPPTL